MPEPHVAPAADPESLDALGLDLARRGDPAAAAEAFRRAVAADPRFARAHHNLGVALGELGDPVGAAEALRQAVAIDPDYFEAHLNLGGVLASAGRPADALGPYGEAVRCRPDSPEALSGLGLALASVGRGAEGAVYLKQATRLRPDWAGAFNNLGLAEADAGRHDAAEAAFDRALQLDPRYAEAHANLGNVFKEQGRMPEALASYGVAVALRPRYASGRWNRSLALLQSGDLAAGWAEYESRWDRDDPNVRRPTFPMPEWDGSPLGGRSVLLWCEQGLGDAVQFVRYAGLLKRAGAGRLTCLCPSPLLGVLATCPWLDAVAPEGVEPPTADLHVPLMSLPWRFGTTLGSVPAEVPYLRPDAERVWHWRAVLAAAAAEGRSHAGGGAVTLNVGIVWQGNPHHRWDRHRSVSLAAFAPLAAVDGVRLVSLQRGPGAEQLASAPFPVLDVLGRSDGGNESACTADESAAVADVLALAAAVDLVVTVDTLPAHLAGAAGADVWVALSTMVDWRWLLGRSDTPWYPTMTLFRQDRRGEWDAVFARIAQAVAERARERSLLRNGDGIDAPRGPAAEPLGSLGQRTSRPPEPVTAPRFTVLLGCYGQFPEYSVRALDAIAAGRDLHAHCDVLVGLNACGRATVDRARALADAGVVQGVVESAANRNKDPMMRLLVEMADTPYVLWLDDDSHFVDPDWPARFAAYLSADHPFDVSGVPARWGPCRADDTAYAAYVAGRPWWRGDAGYPPALREWVPFVPGGLFLARTEFLRRHDFPDRGLVKALDDVLLGELVLQVGGRLAYLPPAVQAVCRVSDGQRRGENYLLHPSGAY